MYSRDSISSDSGSEGAKAHRQDAMDKIKIDLDREAMLEMQGQTSGVAFVSKLAG